MSRNGSKPCQGEFKLDIRKHFFTEGIIEHWERFPRAVVNVPSQSNVKEAFGQCH